MDTMKIAEAVKAYLVDLAIKDKLPMDITMLSEFAIEKVIKKTLPVKPKGKTDLEKFLRKRAKEMRSDWEDVPMWVVKASNEFIELSKPSERDLMVERASHYLSDGDISTEEMCDAIANHEDQYDIIDNVEGVVVWEKVEGSFNCDDFLQEIGYVSK